MPSRNVFYPPKPRPQFEEHFWVSSPAYAAALRDQVLGQGNTPPMPMSTASPSSIGLIQRKENRCITNYPGLRDRLVATWPGVYIEEAYMEGLSFRSQAAFFAKHDVIVAAHGAALTNAVFMRHGTIVLECFPRNYHPVDYYPGLIRQSGGIYVELHFGKQPSEDFADHSRTFEERQFWRSKSFSIPLEESIALLKGALRLRSGKA